VQHGPPGRGRLRRRHRSGEPGVVVADIAANPAASLLSKNVAAGTATVTVVAGGVATETHVTFTNKAAPPKKGTVKVCKVAGPGVAQGTAFTFTVGNVTTTAQAGFCSAALEVSVGDVTVREAPSAAYQATKIEVTGAGTQKSVDLATATTVVTVAAGTTVVTYTNKSKNRPPTCTSVQANPNQLWPPNHKFQTITLSGATDPDGDATALTITGVTQDEALNDGGDGDTSPDAGWVSGRKDQVQVRAERSGTGDGRVYRIAFTVSDGKGGSCTGTVKVGVPHDQSGSGPVDTTSVVVNSFGP
jgi:hypothetical protein